MLDFVVTFCKFETERDGWRCPVCGRVARTKKAPAAVCAESRGPLAEWAARQPKGQPTADEQPPPPTPPPPTRGPGTELKKLLAGWPLYITTTENCSCNAHARKMDIEEARAPGWCIEHIDEIVGWLREEATQRGFPFLDTAGRLLVRRAVAKAKRVATAA